MTYFASSDLELVLGKEQLLAIARDPQDGSLVHEAKVEMSEKAARSEIQIYLEMAEISEIQDVTSWPLIQSIAIDVATFWLHSHKEGPIRDDVKLNYDKAIKTLNQIAQGKLLPPSSLQGVSPVTALVEADPAVFTSELFSKRVNNGA